MKKLKRFLIPLLLCSVVCFIPETRAEVIEATASFNDVPGGTTIAVAGNSTKQATIYLYNYEGITRPYVYLTFSVCTNGPNNYSVTNVGYSNYFLEDEVDYYASGKSCKVNNYDGWLYYVQLKVGKYEDIDGTGEELVASSFFNIKNSWSYGVYYHIKNFYLSSDDTMEAMRSNQQILDKFNAIEDDLSSMNSNLSSINGILSSNNDKIDQTNDKLDDVNDNLGNLNDNITNSDISGSQNTANGFFDNFNTEDNGGISAIVTAPLRAINSMIDGTCQPLTATWRGKTISFPCGTEFWNKMSPIRTFLNVIEGGIICYGILIDLYRMINRMKDPEDDRVDVMSL